MNYSFQNSENFYFDKNIYTQKSLTFKMRINH